MRQSQPAVHQLSVSAAYGDAIGNEIMEIREALRAAGYRSEIFVELVDPRMAREVRSYREYPAISSPNNLILLHYSLGSKVSEMARTLTDRLAIIYHNITPPHWFAPYSLGLARDCARGRLTLSRLSHRCQLAFGDSEYNRKELEKLGFEPTEVLPLMLDFSRLDGPVDPVVRRRFDDGHTNILFVGRVVPNKCFEDLIRSYAYYRRHVDHDSRLLLVGEFRTFGSYYDALRDLVHRLQLQGVHFAGHVTEAELNAYYRTASCFVCMSEHEGFCVPIFEAIHRDLPVVAFNAAAVPHSTGRGVLLLDDKHPAIVAETIAEILSNHELRKRILERQRAALQSIDRTIVMEKLLEHVRTLTS